MPTYKAPVEDVQFLLNDVFHMERYGNMPGFADASPDVVAAILQEAAKFTEEVLHPRPSPFPPKERPPLKMADLPAACRQVLMAPETTASSRPW